MKRSIKSFLSAAVAFSLLTLMVSCIQEDLSVKYGPLVDKYVSYWNTAEMEGVEDVLSQDFELRMTPDFEPLKGIEAFKEKMKGYRSIDFNVILKEVNYASDAAMARWEVTAAYPDSTGANAIHVTSQGLSLIHFKDGKILDEWIAYDNGDWMKQMGYTIEKEEMEQEEEDD